MSSWPWTRYAWVAVGAVLLPIPPSLTAQEGSSRFHLGTLYETGHLLRDQNGDGVPDRVGATLLLSDAPTPAERAAAAELTARLGFETMAMDLPVPTDPDPDRIGIVVGMRALEGAGQSLAALGIDPPRGDTGVVASFVEGSERWLAVLGGTSRGLAAAARFAAGSLPHLATLSSPSLDAVAEEVVAYMVGEEGGPTLEFVAAVVASGPAQTHLHLVADLEMDASLDPAAAMDRLRALADDRQGNRGTEPDSTTLRFPGLTTLEIRNGGQRVALPTRADPPPPGPVPGRPGAGAKGDLDLSNVYGVDGFLGDSDSNEIPDRVDILVVPSADARGVHDLTGRLGLESTGLTLPLVELAEDLEDPSDGPTTVLLGTDHPLIRQLEDSGSIDRSSLRPGQGLIELVPDAFGSKPSLVVTGAGPSGTAAATARLARVFPYLDTRADDAPTFDDVEYDLWGTLSGHTPAGQAAAGLYKLDRIVEELAALDVTRADVLFSVEKPAPGLADVVRARAAGLGAVSVTIDDRDVRRAATIFDRTTEVPSEVDRFQRAFRDRILPRIEAGSAVTLEARLSEPPELRAELADRVRRELIDAGADPDRTEVRVLSAFKQGFSWIREALGPRLAEMDPSEIVVEFLKNDPPEAWPQQAIHTPLRWLHEIFPIDEVLAGDLDIPRERIRFEMVEEGPTYRVRATGQDGRIGMDETFDPVWVLRPYFDRFRDYEQVRVTTGWVRATQDDVVLVDERIVTDPEWVWDHFQSRTLPDVYDYVMDRHEGNPRGGGVDAPFFGELTVELELSEPDYRLGVDNEIIAPMDALHEEIYFGTLEFFHLLGRNARGQDLTYPGRVIPIMRPRGDGRAGIARERLTGFATSRPAVVVRYETRAGQTGERRLDIPRVTMDRPSLRRAVIAPVAPVLARLDLRVRVDAEADERQRWLQLASPEQVDSRMISAAQVSATLRNLQELRAAGLYGDALAYAQVGEIGVWAEWTHEQSDTARVTTVLPPNGSPAAGPDWGSLLPDGWQYDGSRIVQWDTPIPPDEGHEMLAKLTRASPFARMYRVGESYLGRTTWAMDLMPPIEASHWSRAKATTFKPTVVYSARQHANEVSSTSHVLRHAETLLTDTAQRRKLDRVNVVIHPFTNPDGAQLAYDLYRITPDYILHAGYLGSLGMDATSGAGSDFPIYPEAPVRRRIWERWLPDVFLNPHGYPSHQVVQLFSEYTGLVRRGRVTERNWGFNKGWFMPGFGYVDNPRFPRHKEAAFRLRDYITRGINSDPDVFAMNQRNYDRYRRYGAAFDPEVFRMPMTDSVLIEMPLEGSTGNNGGGGFNPRVTIWSGTTEAPDETAYGAWMELVATAGLSWDRAILDYLYEGSHQVERSGSTFFGGVTLKMNRPRPPKEPASGETDEETDRTTGGR